MSDYYTAASNLFQEYHSPYTEQVVILNWPVFTRDAIRTLAQHAQQQSSSESTATDDDLGTMIILYLFSNKMMFFLKSFFLFLFLAI